MANEIQPDNEDIDTELWRRRASRAAYWLGLLPTHPDIEAQRINPPIANRALAQNPVYPDAGRQGFDHGGNGQLPAYPNDYAPPAYPPPAYPPPAYPYHVYPPQAYPPPMIPPPGPGQAYGGAGRPPQSHYRQQQPARQAPEQQDGMLLPLPRKNMLMTQILTSLMSPSHCHSTPMWWAGLSCAPLCAFLSTFPFADFFSQVCANMELDPLIAQLGFKFTGDRKTDPAFRLATEEELRGAMAQAILKIKKARTREVVMEIFNLVSWLYIYSLIVADCCI